MITLASLKFLTMGAFLGLTAGISPGPLLTLVITETLKHNKTEGIKVAISPLVTDLPIILVSLFFFSKLSQFDIALGVISFAGGIFIAYLAYETMKTKVLYREEGNVKPESFKKGITANFLNPHPYLFWCTIGTPLVLKAFEINTVTVTLYFLAFYIALIGSKVAIVLIVSRSKNHIGNKSYIWIMRVLGTVLFLFSIFFFLDGVKYLLHR